MFHDPDQFPFARELQGWWRLIRKEYLELDAPFLELAYAEAINLKALDLYVEVMLKGAGWTPSWQIEDVIPDNKVLTYGLSYNRMQPDGLATHMPITSRLLARLQGPHLAAISLMRPNSFIVPHAHPELKGRRLTLLLGLDLAPKRSFLTVDGVLRELRAGELLIFDGSHQHFAVNMSKADRAILYLEFDPNGAALAPPVRFAETPIDS